MKHLRKKIFTACSSEFVCDLMAGDCHSAQIPGLSHLHSLCHNKVEWYRAWHHNPYRPHVHWGTFFAILFFFSFISLTYYRFVEAAPNFIVVNIKNAKNEALNGSIDFLDIDNKGLGKGDTKTGIVFQGNKNKIKKIQVTFENGPIAHLELDNIIFNEGDLNIPIDEMVSENHWQKKYALGDITGVSFSRGRFKKIATGKDLFKCAEWDFANQTCLGSWKKIAVLAPGTEYIVEFTPGDPGYAESARKVNVLNKKNELLDYDENETSINGVTLTPAQNLGGTTKILPVSEITVTQINETNETNDLIVDSVETSNDNIAVNGILFDTENIGASEVKVKNKANKNILLDCLDYNENANECTKWKKNSDLIVDEDYEIIISSPGKSVWGLAKDGVLVLDKKLEVLPQAQESIAPDRVAVQLIDLNPYKITTYLSLGNTNDTKQIFIDTAETENEETGTGKKISVNLNSASVTAVDINATAIGYNLFKCADFDFENQICRGKYQKLKDLEKGADYVLNIPKEENVVEIFESKKRIALLDKDNYLLDYNESIIVGDGGENLEIIFENPDIIKKIKVKNHVENTPNNLRINENMPLPNIHSLQIFAVDPGGLAATADLFIEAKGNTLYKCKDWDFAEESCFGTWEKIKDITPGEIYTLTVDGADPGFLETNESVPPPVAPTPGSTLPTSPPPAPPTSSDQTTTQTITGDSKMVIGFSGTKTQPIPMPLPLEILEKSSEVTPSPNAKTKINKTSNQSLINTETLSQESTKILLNLNHGVGFNYVGEEARSIQKFLNALGLLVSQTGPGSPGLETRFYGRKTQEAVKRFQLEYGLIKSQSERGAGYVGPTTRAKIKEIIKKP